ncbi:MAG: hypothetical protein U0625_13795 [Phycisphaerales bacterium]
MSTATLACAAGAQTPAKAPASTAPPAAPAAPAPSAAPAAATTDLLTADEAAHVIDVLAPHDAQARERATAAWTRFQSQDREAAGATAPRLAAVRELVAVWRATSRAADAPVLMDRVVAAAGARAIGRALGAPARDPMLARVFALYVAAMRTSAPDRPLWPGATAPRVVDATFALWQTDGAGQPQLDALDASLLVCDSRRCFVQREQACVAALARLLRDAEAAGTVAPGAARRWNAAFARAALPSVAGLQWLEGAGGDRARALARDSGDAALQRRVDELLLAYANDLAARREAIAPTAMTILEMRADRGDATPDAAALLQPIAEQAWAVQRASIDAIAAALGTARGQVMRLEADAAEKQLPRLFRGSR